MTDSDKKPDNLSAAPLTEGSKDMGGYFFHWRRAKGVICAYIVHTTATKDGPRGNLYNVTPGRDIFMPKPSGELILVLHSFEKDYDTYGVLSVGGNVHDRHPQRVN